MSEGLIVLGALAIACAQIWLFVVIFQGSPGAAFLCLIIPFLALSFIGEHWEIAKYPTFLWILGILCLLVGNSMGGGH